MASLRETVVSLILRAKNSISPDAEAAAESLVDLRNETKDLSNTLRDLERQQDAVAAFDATKKAASDAEQGLRDAATAFEAVKDRGQEAGQSQADYNVEMRQARQALNAANTEYNKTQRELSKHTQTLQKAGIDTNNLAEADEKLAQKARDTAVALVEKQQETNAAAKELQGAEKPAEGLGGKLEGLKTKIIAVAAAFASWKTIKTLFTSMLDAGKAAEEASNRFEALYGSAEKGEEALGKIRDIARANAKSFDEMQDAADTLKANGIDPLDGSLQALVDAQSKYGRSTSSVEKLTKELGRAFNEGRMSQRMLTRLTNEGIPVMEALGKITNRSASEVMDLAKANGIGRETVAQLIDELGEMAQGEGANNLNTWSGLIQAFTTEWEDFFRKVAESGAFDKLKESLREILDEVQSFASDGRLDEWAQRLGDAFSAVISVSSRVISGLKLMADTAEAAFKGTAAAIMAYIGEVSEAWGKLIGYVSKDTGAAMQEFGQNMKGAASELADDVAAASERMKENAAHAFLGIEKTALTSGKKIREDVERTQKEQREQIEQTGESLKNYFKQYDSGNMVKAAGNMYLISNALSDIEGKLEASGKSADRFVRELISDAPKEQLDGMREVLDRLIDSGHEGAKFIEETWASVTASMENEAKQQIKATQKQVADGLKELGISMSEYADFVSEADKEAIESLESIVAKMKDTGLEAQEQSDLIAKAYVEAFKKMETEAAEIELQDALKRQFEEGIISAEAYGRALSELSVHQWEVASEAFKESEKARRAEADKAAAVRKTTSDLKDQAKATKELGEASAELAAKNQGAAAALSGALGAARAELDHISDAAGEYFQNYLENMTHGVSTLSAYLNRVSDQHQQIMHQATQQQKQFNNIMAQSDGDLQSFISNAERAADRMSLLGSEDMATLRHAIDDAYNKLASLEDAAAKTAQSLNEELLQIQGKADEIQQIRYEQRKAELEAQLEGAKHSQQATQDLQDALRLNEQIHREKMKQLNEQEKKQMQQQAEPATAPAPSATTSKQVRIEITTGRGQSVGVYANNDNDAEKLVALLESFKEYAT